MIPGEKPSLAGLQPESVEREVQEAFGDVTPEEVEQLLEGAIGKFTPGTVLNGRIMGELEDEVVVDIGYKSEGFVSKSEFEDPSSIKAGEMITVYVDAVEELTGQIMISKRKADRIKSWERVIQNHVVDDVITGRVVRKIKGGLLVDIGVPAFLPASQVDLRRVGDVSEYVGQNITAKIIKIDPERRNIVVSRRKLLEDDREKQKKKLLVEIQRGEVRRGLVKNLTDFGAFVDLGGIDGLLHITDMSWGRISHPSEIVREGDEIDVRVLDFDLERERISLGLKQLAPNPWTLVRQKYPIGSKIGGKVVSLQPYGAFVKVEDGVEGLVHVSDMSWGKPVNHPSEVVKPGDEVDVVVLSIDEERQEISLGLKQAQGDPWETVRESFPPGSRVKGLVKSLTSYGAFVELAEGVEGLLHVSDISWTKKILNPSSILKKGEELEAVVLNIDKERRRISLGMKQLSEDPWEGQIPRQFRPGARVKGKVTKLANFGAFVEIGPDLEGLLHVSEISSEQKIEKPEEVLQQGQEIEVRIISMDPRERKISLSMKAAQRPDAGPEGEEFDYQKYIAPEGTGTVPLEAAKGGEILRRATEAEADKEAAARPQEDKREEERPQEELRGGPEAEPRASPPEGTSPPGDGA